VTSIARADLQTTGLGMPGLEARDPRPVGASANHFLTELDRYGIVRLPPLVSDDRLQQMQRAFLARLRRMRWNNVDGYEKTESYRRVVEDVLTVDQGFVDIGLHPLVKAVLSGYLGDTFQLVEAKGWKSLPTKRDFHGWHGDAWYDQALVQGIPREVKLAFYLTDVTSGAFNYVTGSHRKQHPRLHQNAEVEAGSRNGIAEVTGPAGSAFLFDTSGVHRQGVPILEPRQAVFYNYHDPSVPLQAEDRRYYRYHPLLLNAAFLGGLSEDDHRILGFGDLRRYFPAFERTSKHELFRRSMQATFDGLVRASTLLGRVHARLQRVRGR